MNIKNNKPKKTELSLLEKQAESQQEKRIDLGEIEWQLKEAREQRMQLQTQFSQLDCHDISDR